MKTFTLEYSGKMPKTTEDMLMKYNGLRATKELIDALDSDIEFLVCDIRECHGNLNRQSKEAWLSPRNGDGSFNLNISFK